MNFYYLFAKNQAEIGWKAENSLDDFWKTQLNKERARGKISKIVQAALDGKKRITIKERIASGKNK